MKAARWLERALLFALATHVLAMFTMAGLLLPGMPGGFITDDGARIAYIAEHPALWRLGWSGWQLTALSDVLLALAIWRTSWIPRLPALLTLLVTMIAIIPDQGGQALWITRGVGLASTAHATGGLAPYLEFEAEVYSWIAVWATIGYTLMAVGWSWCFAAAGTWNRTLTWLSVVTWTMFGYASAGLLLPPGLRPSNELVAVLNAVGFVLLLIWFVLVMELVLRRSRPAEAHGRLAIWRHPNPGTLGRLFDLIGNSRFVRAIGELVPPITFVSDITDVIYINYLVEAKRLEALVPQGLELQRLGSDGRWGLFTFLTYRHGHFGPRLPGPLRRLLPSPIQSNWRIHVRDPRIGSQGIYFVSTAIDHTLHALAARHLSEGLPMHVLRRGEVRRDEDDSFYLLLDPGAGSAPDAEARLHAASAAAFSEPWASVFGDFHGMLAYCVPQDRALSSQPWYGRVTRHEIRLGIPLEACELLDGPVVSRAAEAIVGDAKPLCFRVAKVAFQFDRQEYDWWTTAQIDGK